MGLVTDIGVGSRLSVAAPVQLLLGALMTTRPNIPKLSILTDVKIIGGRFIDFSGTSGELIQEFLISDILGFQIGFGGGTFISVWPPKCFNSALEAWRIVAETDEKWDEALLDKVIEFPEVDYAVISQDETLDLEELDHVNRNNFPWAIGD
jgi:hypothetical protein